MAVPQGVWGIDIGQCALKALRLEMVEGVLTATAFDYVEHPKILSQPDADPDALTREALTTFLSRNTIKGDVVAMSVAGQSGLARFVKLPPVEEKKIGDIVRFEAKQQIPFPLEEVVWDFQKIGQGVVTDGFALETEIGLFAMKRDMVNRFLQHFQAVNVEVHIVQMSPLALCNYSAYELLKKGGPDTALANEEPAAGEESGPAARGKKKCVVTLDLGTDASNLVITDGDKIIWQRPIPLGGNHFTRALTKEMKLTFAKAEHLKRHAAKSAELGTILKALKPVLSEFVGEVQRSLGYFTNTHRDAQVMHMVGLGNAFRLPGLQKFLAEKLQLEVKKPAKFERLAGESVTGAELFHENLLTFPVAFGLALQGLHLSKLHTNLLPQEIQFDRMIRAKKPWAVAAAAALLLGTGVYALGQGIEYGGVRTGTGEGETKTKIGEAIQEADNAASQVTTTKSNIDDEAKKVDQTVRDVKSIIAGQDERPNWLRINEYINACLPEPLVLTGNAQQQQREIRESNLGVTPQVAAQLPYYPGKDRRLNQPRYWVTAEGQAVLQRLRELSTGRGNTDIPLDYDSRKALAMVDLESVEFRYVDTLEQVVPKAVEQVAQRESANPATFQLDGLTLDQQKPEAQPKGPGWIVEIRGSTYHQDGRQFLRDTLLYNLNTWWTPQRQAARAGKPIPPISPTEPASGTSTSTTIPSENEASATAPDPIQGRVGHAFLFHYWFDDHPVPGQFTHIQGGPYVNELLSALPAGTTTAEGSNTGGNEGMGGNAGQATRKMMEKMQGMRGGGGPGAPGPTGGAGGGSGPRGGWSGGFQTGSGTPGTMGATGPGNVTIPGLGNRGSAPGSVTIPGLGGRSPGKPGPGGGAAGDMGMTGRSGAPGAQQTTATQGKPRRRHEFVIIMLWREPTPTDKLFSEPKP